MGRIRKDCPVCFKQGLLRLPNHLRDVHGLDPQEVMESQSNSGDASISVASFDADSESSTVDDASDVDEETESDDTESDEEEDAHASALWLTWVSPIFQHFQEDMDERATELAEDMSTGEAQEITWAEFLPAMNNKLQQKLIIFSNLSHQFKKDPLYQKIMETAKTGRREDDMDWEESVSYAVNKRKLLLDRVLQTWTPSFDVDDEMEEDSE